MNWSADFLKELKRNESKGRCLHYESGEHCNKIINAHSIQKSNQLGIIAEAGHVYRLSSDLSIMHKNNGKPAPKKIGLKKASTFAGFCKKHDNELFKPIDDTPLEPTPQQVSLYAYRCLCREFFVKQNAKSSMEALMNHPSLPVDVKRVMCDSAFGQSQGFNRLQYHKEIFDAALSAKRYHEFQYVTFEFTSSWDMQLSGVLFPDYDFSGNHLQDISDWNKPLDFISFFTSPTSEGWAFSICWHESSNPNCFSFFESLRAAVSKGGHLGDFLFRFAISCCENHVFRISWWDNLRKSERAEIIARVELMTDLFTPVPRHYLTEGMEGIVNWECEKFHTSLLTKP